MNHSQRLVLEFIKRHHELFDTDCTKSSSALNSFDISDFEVLNNGVKIFTTIGNAVYVKLPCELEPYKSSKKVMLSRVHKLDIVLNDSYNDNSDWYLVTQNRLDVLEEIMYNSGIDVSNSAFTEENIVNHDLYNNEIDTSSQQLLTSLKTYCNNSFYSVADVIDLCERIDVLYSAKLRKKDEQLCIVDPKFIECNSKIIELATSTLSSALDTMNKLFVKLTVMLKQK